MENQMIIVILAFCFLPIGATLSIKLFAKFMKYACKIVILWVFVALSLHPARAQTGFSQQGEASYYAQKFNGRTTANGEIFKNSELTAAHLDLPFNTILKVTNLESGKTVIVRINDRGPFIRGRIIDLSKAAAHQLDMVIAGTANVKLEVIGEDGEIFPEHKEYAIAKAARPAIKNVSDHRNGNLLTRFITGRTFSLWGTEKFPKGYGVQVASFSDLENAQGMCKELIEASIQEVYIQVGWVTGEKVYRVLAGAFDHEADAQIHISLLESNGFDGFIKKHL